MTTVNRSPRDEVFHHGFYEVFLPVTDVDRAIGFYVDKLGFHLGRRESPSSALLLYDDHGTRSMLGLSQVEAIERRSHLSLRVLEKDVDRMVSYLVERGIEPVHPPRARVQGPMREPIVHGWMPAASVFFTDPDGHLLELIADLADARRPEVSYCPLSEWRGGAEHSKS
jgi:catechol 2,3-dioxygenase-like lactoylglutathione lyase family enzyme